MIHNHKLKVAIIGLGQQNIADHLPVIINNKKVILDSICDINVDMVNKMSVELGIKGFLSVEDLITNSKPDIAIVALPHNQYLEIITKLANAGIHIFKEKPFAITVEEAKFIINIAKNNNIKLQVAVQRRYKKTYNKFHEYKTKIGKIYSIHAHYTLNIDRLDVGWRASKKIAGGGALIDMGYHIIDLLNWYFGLPETITAKLGYKNRTNQDYDVEDTAKILFDYNNLDDTKILGSILISRIYPKKEEQITIYGTEGSITIEKNKISRLSLNKEELESSTCNEKHSCQKQIDHFVDIVLGICEDERVYEEHLKNVIFIESCYKSDENNSIIMPKLEVDFNWQEYKYNLIRNYLSKKPNFNSQKYVLDYISNIYYHNLDANKIYCIAQDNSITKDIFTLTDTQQICNDIKDLELAVYGKIEQKNPKLYDIQNKKQFSKQSNGILLNRNKVITIKVDQQFYDNIRQVPKIGDYSYLTSAIKANLTWKINEHTNSKIIYLAHDIIDHRWFFGLLVNNKLFEKYSKFFESIGNPIDNNITSRESELISGISYSMRSYSKYNKLIINKKIILDILKSSSSKSHNQQNVIKYIEGISDNKLLDKINFTISNYLVQNPTERIRFGIIKIKEENIMRDIKILEPEFVAFLIEAVVILYQNEEYFVDIQIKTLSLIEELLKKIATSQYQPEYNFDTFYLSDNTLSQDIQIHSNNNLKLLTY